MKIANALTGSLITSPLVMRRNTTMKNTKIKALIAEHRGSKATGTLRRVKLQREPYEKEMKEGIVEALNNSSTTKLRKRRIDINQQLELCNLQIGEEDLKRLELTNTSSSPQVLADKIIEKASGKVVQRLMQGLCPIDEKMGKVAKKRAYVYINRKDRKVQIALESARNFIASDEQRARNEATLRERNEA